MGAGGIISWKGDYWPFLVFGPLITPIGAGLLYAVQQDTASGYLIGAQICLGGGIGLAFQNTVISVQADLHDTPDRIPQGTALATFFQLIGGVVGISISGTLFNNQLAKELGKRHVSTEIVDGQSPARSRLRSSLTFYVLFDQPSRSLFRRFLSSLPSSRQLSS
jgi:Na+/glutamate symporter